MNLWHKKTGFAGIAAAIAVATAPLAAHAQSAVASFYSGKSITVVVAAGAGGPFGLRSHILAQFLGRHMPGKPNVIEQFMPGAGGRKAANYLYKAAPKDGSVIGVVFYNTALGIVMFLGRFWIIIPVLALAGSLVAKKRVPEGAGTLATHAPLFVFFLLVLLLGRLLRRFGPQRLAVLGLVVAWHRPSARLLALAWGASAALALGPVLAIGGHRFIPLAAGWHGVRMSAVLPYTWFVHIPGLAAFREADRLALIGLVPAALLAGSAVAWLGARARPLLIAALAAAALEAGYAGNPQVGIIPTTMPALDSPIAADRSGSLVVDVPFGLRGGVAPYGRRISYRALVLATADGHPRASSYTSWVPASTVAAIARHPFYRRLNAAESGQGSSPTQLRLARQDLRRMRVGWAMVWKAAPAILAYLRGTGFRFRYRAYGVLVFRRLILVFRRLRRMCDRFRRPAGALSVM